MPSHTPVTVTLAEIARLAGVGRAAVTNWRRRYSTFPSPAGGTDTNPRFALTEVEAWLRAEGKLRREDDALKWLWPQFDGLGDRATAGEAIAALAEAAAAPQASGRLEPAQQEAVSEALGVAETQGLGRTYGFLLDRWLHAHVRQITTTPAPLTDLMVELAESCGGGPRTVLDPACGTGGLLLAAGRRWASPRTLDLMGADDDPVLARLAAGRMATAELPKTVRTRIRTADTLRADAWPDERADVVLCNPPYNTRDWGHEELATDTRWTLGHPPRTEPELAWVQHVLARLADDGTAVMLLPPGVAKRRAGRRIRAGLLRTAALRAVIALPAGAAPPHSIGLHIWVLRRPVEGTQPLESLLFIDVAEEEERGKGDVPRPPIDWAALLHGVPAAVQAHEMGRNVEPKSVRYNAVPLIDLLDEQVDLTPARHVPAASGSAAGRARRTWDEFTSTLAELQELAAALSALKSAAENTAQPPLTSIDELLRAGALHLHSGQTLSREAVQHGPRPDGSVPLLTMTDLLRQTGPSGWLGRQQVSSLGEHVTLTAADDVVVAGSSQAFDVWVEEAAPTAIGPQVLALRANPAMLDPWFLAGCLRSPGNLRQAGSHSTHASRINVRMLKVPRMPLADQQRYGEAFRRVVDLEQTLKRTSALGSELTSALSDILAEGRLR
ncbi:N-6 DNA methylase [Streptomyces sioyaensis]|uniref:N-6 DNA methylase n=1 Tax=Streptomyces sioyaensis TaxID=67364 RepID=UPI003D71B688